MSVTTESVPGLVREVYDCCGRRYRVGPSARRLTGHSRAWMLWLPWAAMAAVGVLQYGFGAAVPALSAAHGWPPAQTFWLLALWTVCQAGVGLPTAYLRERGVVGPRTVMLLGAALCLAGPVTLANSNTMGAAVLGYSVLSGTGAGLVYAGATSVASKWHPERSASKVSFVTGAFAYGSVPFVIAYVIGMTPTNLPVFMGVTGLLIGLVVAFAGILLRDPPAHWWPPHLDPQRWALDNRLNPGRVANPPAVRQFTPHEAIRTGVLPIMYVLLFFAGAVSLFNVTFFATYALWSGLTPWPIAVGAALLVGLNGAGRAFAIRVSNRLGRRRTLSFVLSTLALGQLCFAGAASAGIRPLLFVAVALAGIGGGAFYPLFASLTRDYFGERNTLEIHGVIYSAKAFAGICGVGLAAVAVPAFGYPAVFLLACVLALGSALLSRRLRRPGHH
ncbi:OFA family MFS transporter [Fodinicola feengrottensis]|uniref:OFA family MFS transporter n=1 Tax=Fodinicola feengrottensis TaxID=435914 RepID=A0ABN2HCU2_9ACTN